MKFTVALVGLLAGSGFQAGAGAFDDSFTTDPAASGWFAVGNTNLFRWDAAAGALAATWDSREPNSYFARPLGTVLTRTNDFCLVFDLKLTDFTPNIDPAKTNSAFQLSVGFINLASATAPGFHRGSGWESPNLCDFSFFPDPGGDWLYGPSLTAMIADGTGFNWSSGGFSAAGLASNDVFRVTMSYRAAEGLLRTELLRNGEPFLALSPAKLSPNFTDFQFDHVAICSYNDAGQWPGWEGSLLAHGAVENVCFAPWLPVNDLTLLRTPTGCEVRFASHTNWLYTLQRTTDWQSWQGVTPATPGNDAALTLTDTNPPPASACYRVKAAKP
jgi:hypothetical protein